jgi:hypothetical protein
MGINMCDVYKDVNRIYFPAPIPKYFVLYKSSPIPHISPSLMGLEHTVRPTSTRKQDILRKFRPQFPKPRLRCRLFLRWLSSFNLCFTLCLCGSESHGFRLLESKSFKPFLLSCLSSCFFRRCDTVYQLSNIKGGVDGDLRLLFLFQLFLTTRSR